STVAVDILVDQTGNRRIHCACSRIAKNLHNERRPVAARQLCRCRGSLDYVVPLPDLLDDSSKLCPARRFGCRVNRGPLSLPIATSCVGFGNEKTANLHAMAFGVGIDFDVYQYAQGL